MTPSWLRKHGVNGEPDELKRISRAAQDAWVMRSGITIAATLTEEQVEEYQRAPNEDQSLAVIEKYVPNYKVIVEHEADLLHDEFAQSPDKVALLEQWAQEYSVK